MIALLQIALATTDDMYANRFIEAASSLPSWQNEFRVMAFTKGETLQQFILEEAQLDVLLLSSSMIDKLDGDYQHNFEIIYLTESSVEGDVNTKYISPYQPVSVILSLVKAHVTERGNRTGPQNHNPINRLLNRVKVNAICSAAGGSGKTMTAIQLARRYSVKEQVLYINLECPSGIGAWLKGREHILWDEFLYFVKENRERLSTKLPDYMIRDTAWNFMCLPSPANMTSSKQLDADDIIFLLSLIDQNGYADRVILDLDCSSLLTVGPALAYADHVLWVLTEDRMAQEKEKCMVLEFQKRDWLNNERLAVHFVFNRCLTEPKGLEWLDDQFGSGHWSFLPYVSEWKLIQHKSEWDPPAQYTRQLDRLLEHIDKEGLRL